ncbi:MAG: hypothetical protein R6V10_10580 [bacterium]
MRTMNAESGERVEVDSGFEALYEQVHRVYESNSLETYFRFLDEFVDAARRSLSRLQEGERREHLQEQYQQVIEYAVHLACQSPT